MIGEKVTAKSVVQFSFRILSATLVSIISFVLAFLIRFEFNVNTPVFDAWFSAYANNVVQLGFIAMVCFVVFEIMFRLKRKQFWSDFIKIILAVGTIELLTYLYMFGKPQSLVRSVYIISFLLMFFFLFQARFIANFFSWKRWQIRKQKGRGKSEANVASVEKSGYLESLDKLAFTAINSKLEGRNVMVSGAGEDYGRALCNQLANFKIRRLILMDINAKGLFETYEELSKKTTNTIIEAYTIDIREKRKLANIFEKYRPHVVFHTGGYKHFIDNEENRREVIATNLIGTKNMVELAVKNLAESFILFSQNTGGKQSDILGRLKRKEEQTVKRISEKENTNFYVYRTGKVEKNKEVVDKIAALTLEIFTVKDGSIGFEAEENEKTVILKSADI